MTKSTLTKCIIYWRLAYSFRGLIHYHHGAEHGARQECAEGVPESYIPIYKQRECGWVRPKADLVTYFLLTRSYLLVLLK